MKSILCVKFGWSASYQGEAVSGDFSYLEYQGHEAFTFLPDSDGTYYAYVSPVGPNEAAPWRDYNLGWTVVCLAKKPDETGIHIVGWYENATLIGRHGKRPLPQGHKVADADGTHDWVYYCIMSQSAFLVPEDHRKDPFSHPAIGQAKYVYLDGAGVHVSDNKREVLAILEEKISLLRSVAVHNPTAGAH